MITQFLDIIRNYIINLSQNGYLPEYFSYVFVINSLIATLFIGPILGGIWYYGYNKKNGFFSEAIGHAALSGIALAIIFGESYQSPYITFFLIV